jgi:hypothetical protein
MKVTLLLACHRNSADRRNGLVRNSHRTTLAHCCIAHTHEMQQAVYTAEIRHQEYTTSYNGYIRYCDT